MSTLQPANVATPATAAFGLAVQVERRAPRGGQREGHAAGAGRDGVAAGVLDGDDRLGREGRLADVPPPGWVVNASLLAAPTVIVKLLLVADVSEPPAAVSV